MLEDKINNIVQTEQRDQQAEQRDQIIQLNSSEQDDYNNVIQTDIKQMSIRVNDQNQIEDIQNPQNLQKKEQILNIEISFNDNSKDIIYESKDDQTFGVKIELLLSESIDISVYDQEEKILDIIKEEEHQPLPDNLMFDNPIKFNQICRSEQSLISRDRAHLQGGDSFRLKNKQFGSVDRNKQHHFSGKPSAEKRRRNNSFGQVKIYLPLKSKADLENRD